MNGQLSYLMVEAHQQELRRAAERARLAHELSAPSRLAGLWRRIASVSSIHASLQAGSPARRPAARGAGEV